MIDWENAKPADFDCYREAQDATESNTHIHIPVRVVHRKSSETIFTKSVPLRKDFYMDMKKRSDFIETISKIIISRCREDLMQRINKNTMSVDDKVALLTQKPQAIE